MSDTNKNAGLPPREGRPEWMTREWVNHAMDCPWVISYGATAHMAREILACWDQIAEMARDRDRALAELDRCGVRIRTLSRELEQARAQAEWRPIETAPRDGVAVLVLNQTEEWVVAYEDCGGWHCRYSDSWVLGPTHWMPLPPPPREAQSQARETEDDGC